MIDYSGRAALVTGGASGIGRALAAALSARGAAVVVADIDLAGAEETARMCGERASALAIDLTDPGAAARMVAEGFVRHGQLDLVASNAGLSRPRRLLKEEFDAPGVIDLFEVNFSAGLRIAQAYVAELEARGQRGRLMLTGSENSLSVPAAVKGAGLGLYAATKHALLIAAEWLRDELAGGGKPLDLHILLPGAVYTPMVAKRIPDFASAPPELALILPERCAELALAGLDAGLFYIPTHAHLADDMGPRAEGVRAALATLGLR